MGIVTPAAETLGVLGAGEFLLKRVNSKPANLPQEGRWFFVSEIAG